jgi:hypothetical protein
MVYFSGLVEPVLMDGINFWRAGNVMHQNVALFVVYSKISIEFF